METWKKFAAATTVVIIVVLILLLLDHTYLKEGFRPCFRNYKLEGIPNIQAPATYKLNQMNRDKTYYSVPYTRLYDYSNDPDIMNYLEYRTVFDSPIQQLGGCAPLWLYNPYMTLG